MSTNSIALFTGDKAAFPTWESSVFDFAESASVLHALGCLPDTMPDALFLALGHAPYIPLTHPGPEPEQLEDELLAEFALRNKIWMDKRARFELKGSQIKLVKQTVVDVLRASALRLITHPLTGTRGYTLKQIMTLLRAAYGTMSSADITANVNKCKIPFVVNGSNTLQEHMDIHLNSHAVGAANNAEENEPAKIRNLTESLAPCGLYSAAILLTNVTSSLYRA